MSQDSVSDDQTSELVFYTNPRSRGRIIRWMLEEVGAPYETVLLDYARPRDRRRADRRERSYVVATLRRLYAKARNAAASALVKS